MNSFSRALLKIMIPITQWVGRRSLPFVSKKITGHHFFAIQQAVRVGDVLCSRSNGHLSNLLIPGEYKHAAIYVGNNQVIEALGNGVVVTDLIDFSMSKDAIKVVRPKFCSEEAAARAAEIARSLEGSPYDYLFEYDLGRNRAFYCSEVIWYSYETAMAAECKKNGCEGFYSPFTPRESLGIQTITPNDISMATAKWENIATLP